MEVQRQEDEPERGERPQPRPAWLAAFARDLLPAGREEEAMPAQVTVATPAQAAPSVQVAQPFQENGGQEASSRGRRRGRGGRGRAEGERQDGRGSNCLHCAQLAAGGLVRPV